MSGKYPEKFAVIPKAKATWAHSNDASWSTDDNITLAKNPPFYRHYSDGNRYYITGAVSTPVTPENFRGDPKIYPATPTQEEKHASNRTNLLAVSRKWRMGDLTYHSNSLS